MNTTIDWAEYGIELAVEAVSEQHGPNGSDRVVVSSNALIPVVRDVQKFIAAFGPETLLKFVNGTSLRVRAQAVARQMAGERDTGKREQALLNSIKSIRNSGTRTVTVKVYALPNGQEYKGSDLIEYQQEYAAALVDAGVDPAIALSVARTVTL